MEMESVAAVSGCLQNGSSCVVVVMGLSALEHCIESLTDPFAEPAWSSQLALAAIN